MVLGSEEMDLLLPSANHGADLISPGEPLTSREIEILGLLAEGMANKDIAAQLHISEHTVKFHVSSILAKLGAGNRSEAVARGIREGLILI
jgi:DNA-binding NarL/FixJ family response regulator